MGTRRHAQGGTCPPPPGNVEKRFLLLPMLSKTSVDEVFMHHFDKMSSAYGGFAPRPAPRCPWTLLGDFRPSDRLIARPWKKSCGRPWLV